MASSVWRIQAFFRAINEAEFPGSVFLIYLCEPVMVVRYKQQKRFDSFEDFKNHVEEVKWITELAWAFLEEAG